MGKVRVSAVSYLNSIPFVYGLEQSDLLPAAIDLSLDIPSVCAEKLLSDEVDLGLIPVATIPDLSNPQIISEYCIGADGPVQTVCLFSSVPLENITTVLLDFHSRTSVQCCISQRLWTQHLPTPPIRPAKRNGLRDCFNDANKGGTVWI